MHVKRHDTGRASCAVLILIKAAVFSSVFTAFKTVALDAALCPFHPRGEGGGKACHIPLAAILCVCVIGGVYATV